MRQSIALSFAIAGCVLSASAFADFRADFVSIKGNGNQTLSRIELSGTHVRVDSSKGSMIIDTGSGKTLMLLHDKHEYMDLGEMAQSVNAMLANVPPQMREMVKQRMAAHGTSGNVSYAPTGKSGAVNARACEIYATRVNGRHTGDVCLAAAAAAGVSGADEATLQRAFEQLKAVASKASAGMIHTSIQAMPVGKFPVRITQYDDAGAASAISELKQLSTSAVPAGDFAIPAGYTEMQMPTLGMPN